MKATPGMQKIVNIVARHLRKQKYACMNEEGSCKYRYKNRKCAAGRLIPDSLYTPNMESQSFPDIVNRFPALRKHITKNFGSSKQVINLIHSMQTLHDLYAKPQWCNAAEERLIYLCDQYKLVYPKP